MNIELINFKLRLKEVLEVTGKIELTDLEICHKFSENLIDELYPIFEKYKMKVSTEFGSYDMINFSDFYQIAEDILKKIGGENEE